METIFDVALQSDGSFVDEVDHENGPQPVDSLTLHGGVQIGPLPFNLSASQIMDACEPAGWEHRPTRMYGYRYAFYRKVEPGSNKQFYEWDHDGVLGRTLFVSRLIHPTTISGQYSARLIFLNGKLQHIIPGHVQGFGTHVYIFGEKWRDWISSAEASELQRVLPLFVWEEAATRIKMSRSHIAYAFHAFYLDQAIASLVTAFEGLLLVGHDDVVKQFKVRISSLADAFGETISRTQASNFYDLRSGFVHGSFPSFAQDATPIIPVYHRFKRLLSKVLIKASTDREFAKNV